MRKELSPEKISECRHKEILSLKRVGDWGLVSTITGLSEDNVRQAFRRIGSKHYELVISALEEIIENRKKLLNQ